jgi:hypothetical protein
VTRTLYVPMLPMRLRDDEGRLVVGAGGVEMPDMTHPVRFEPIAGRSNEFATYRTLKKARDLAGKYGRVVAIDFGRLDDVAARPGLVVELEAAERNMLRWAAEAERIKRLIEADREFADGAFL